MSKRYRAFISYSQLDKKWAKKLQRALENYRVPADVLADIELTSTKFGRVFRDDDDISASGSLGAALEGALADSETLVAICSPNSAKSKWVDMEVRRFKTAADAKYFAVIIDGQPNSGDPTNECFVPALRFEVDEAGELTDTPDEPLAPDWRKDGLRKLTARLVAGILGVSFDDIWNREQRRVRKRRWAMGIGSVALLSTMILVSVVTIRAQNNEIAMQLTDLSQQAIKAAMSDQLEDDRGANYERGLRFAALAAHKSYLHPRQAKAEALLEFANQQAPIEVVVEGHRGGVTMARFSAAGEEVVSAGEDQWLRTWSADTGTLMSEHAGVGKALAIDQDGQFAAMVNDTTQEFLLWDIEARKPHRVLDTGGFLPEFASFSPDHSVLIAGSTLDSTLSVWAVGSGSLLAMLPNSPESKPVAAALNSENTQAAVVSLDNRLTLWDLNKPEILHQIETKVRRDQNLAISPSGKRVMTGRRQDFAVFLLPNAKKEALLTGKSVYTQDESRFAVVNKLNIEIRTTSNAELLVKLIGHEGKINSLTWNSTASQILTASDDGTARLWEAVSGSELRRFEGHAGAVVSAEFDPLEKKVLTVGDDGSSRVFSAMSTPAVVKRAMLTGHTGSFVSPIFFTDSGQQLVTVGRDNTVRIWDSESGAQTSLFKSRSKYDLDKANYLPADQRLVLTSIDGSVSVINTESGEETQTFEVDQKSIDARQLFTAQFDRGAQRIITPQMGRAQVWDAASGELVSLLQPSTEQFYDIRTSANGERAVSLSWEGITRVWNLETGQSIAQLEGHVGLIETADISHDGRWVVTAGQDGTASIWNAETGDEIRTIEGFDGSVLRVRFSPNSVLVAATAADGTTRIIDAKSFSDLETLEKHAAGANIVDFHTPSKTILTAGWDNSVRLWDLRTGLQTAKVDFPSSVSAAVLSPAGNLLAVSSGQSEITLWETNTRFDDVSTLSLQQVCDSRVGKLKGEIRFLTRADVIAAPMLSGREGEDVCAYYD